MPGQFNKGKVPLHYAAVADICISKCPTLKNDFSVFFFIQGVNNFCLELCNFPKNLERKKKKKNQRGKRWGKMQNPEGGVC